MYGLFNDLIARYLTHFDSEVTPPFVHSTIGLPLCLGNGQPIENSDPGSTLSRLELELVALEFSHIVQLRP